MNSLPFKKRSENLKVSIFKKQETTKSIWSQCFLEALQKQRKNSKTTPYYNSGDLIGRQGVEESYEEILRGIKQVNTFKEPNTNENWF
jgi:cell division protein FtsI/penicillin-binding protein 2